MRTVVDILGSNPGLLGDALPYQFYLPSVYLWVQVMPENTYAILNANTVKHCK